MKSSVAMNVVIALAVLFGAALIYQYVQLASAARQVSALKAANAASEAHMAAIQGSLDSIRKDIRRYDAAVGPQGSLQLLAKSLESGETELTLKSLRIVAKGKTVVSLGSIPDSGGIIHVGSTDGTSSADISSGSGKSKIGFRSTSGADAGQAVHLATYGDDGYTLQKGPSDDAAAKTDGAGLRILDEGPDFYMAQSGGGNVSIATSSADERAKLSMWSEGNPKRVIYVSLGTKDIAPFVSVAGALSGNSLTLLPDRLSLANRGGTVVLATAADNDGGFVFVNDKAGAQRALISAGSDGKGTISVFGNDNRSNTLYPEYNIQRVGSGPKK